MKLCLLADWSGQADEGMKKAAHHLFQGLSPSHQVLSLDPRQAFTAGFWKNLRAFQPQVIHYLPGPSIASFLLVGMIKARLKGVKTVMSALHPSFYGGPGLAAGWSYLLSPQLRWMVPWLKPDLLLVQSEKAESLFRGLGCRTAFLGNGVDTSRFLPAERERKQALRQKYGLVEKDFLVLHVGSIARWRNLELLLQLPQPGLLIGSTSTEVYPPILKRLKEGGWLVWRDFIPEIEEIYALADCYLFPARWGIAAIEMPLGVLEAMACNLPVVTTPFGALPRIFPPGDGLYFADIDQELVAAVGKVSRGQDEAKTREKVLPFSWDKIVSELESIYQKVLG